MVQLALAKADYCLRHVVLATVRVHTHVKIDVLLSIFMQSL